MATIRKHGVGYQARIRRRGWPVQSKTFPTKGAAERWARQVEAQMDADVFEPAAPEQHLLTLGAALDRYAREVTPHKNGAMQEQTRIKAWQRRPLAARALGRIRSTDLAAWRDARLQEVSASTVRLELAVISHLYTIARKEWGMGGLQNPVDGVRKPQAVNARDRRLEAGEEDRLLAAAGEVSAELAAFVRLALETGMRLSEIAGLQWRHIDLASHVAHLPKTKNGTSRSVPLSDAATAVLISYPRRLDEHVFGPNTASISSRISHQFSRMCKQCGFHDLHFHDLRHEATSRFFERGFDIMEVASITGHKTLAMLKRYTHMRAADLAKKLRA